MQKAKTTSNTCNENGSIESNPKKIYLGKSAILVNGIDFQYSTFRIAA